ncbi:hypothetical protein LINPERPRIM_LOCUS17013 [Linum perenne]
MTIPFFFFFFLIRYTWRNSDRKNSSTIPPNNRLPNPPIPLHSDLSRSSSLLFRSVSSSWSASSSAPQQASNLPPPPLPSLAGCCTPCPRATPPLSQPGNSLSPPAPSSKKPPGRTPVPPPLRCRMFRAIPGSRA